MLITRWQAPNIPKKEQIKMWFEMEGLEPREELIEAGSEFSELRHPFDDIIMVAEGQIVMDVAGNKLLLREGDRLVIPSNTKFSKKVEGEGNCLLIVANRTS